MICYFLFGCFGPKYTNNYSYNLECTVLSDHQVSLSWETYHHEDLYGSRYEIHRNSVSNSLIETLAELEERYTYIDTLFVLNNHYSYLVQLPSGETTEQKEINVSFPDLDSLSVVQTETNHYQITWNEYQPDGWEPGHLDEVYTIIERKNQYQNDWEQVGLVNITDQKFNDVVESDSRLIYSYRIRPFSYQNPEATNWLVGTSRSPKNIKTNHAYFNYQSTEEN